MVVHLADGGRVRVLKSGTVEFRRNGQTFRADGKGNFADSVRWVESLAFGREVRYVTQ